MAKMTIAQLREKEVYRLSEIIEGPDPEYEDHRAALREAHRLMNSYYRLCGLSERVLYLSNNERTCNSKYTLELEDREYNWYMRLDGEFKKYGLHLYTAWSFPQIFNEDNRLAITPYFYK